MANFPGGGAGGAAATVAAAALEFSGTHRVPPSWTPGNDYSFRDWERDVENWLNLTDLTHQQVASAIYQRLGGMAKVLVREIPQDILTNGTQTHSAYQILMNSLRARWGGDQQNKQLELLEAYESFAVRRDEDYEDAITRFDVVRTRARDEAGLVASNTSLSRKLLLAFRVPDEQWPLVLAPTLGLLPANDGQYEAFINYLKRHLSLFYRKSNIVHPRAPTALDNNKSTSGTFFAGVCGREGSVSNAGAGHNDGGILRTSRTSTSAYHVGNCRNCGHYLECPQCADEEEEDYVENDFVDSDSSLEFGEQEEEAEQVYLSYEQSAAEWDNTPLPPEAEEIYQVFLEKARRWNKLRKFGRFNRDTRRRDGDRRDDRGERRRPRFRKSRFKFLPKRRQMFFEAKKNPVGRDGKVMECSICSSDTHLRAFCPKKKKPSFSGGKPRSQRPSTSPFLVAPHSSASSSASARPTPTGAASSSTPAAAPAQSVPSWYGDATFVSTPIAPMMPSDWRYFCQEVGPQMSELPEGLQDSDGAASFEYVNSPLESPVDQTDKPPDYYDLAVNDEELDDDEQQSRVHFLYPWSSDMTQVRLAQANTFYPVHSTSQLRGVDREGLLVDSGAIDNLSGKDFVDRQAVIAKRAGHATTFSELGGTLEVNGVGTGSQAATYEASVPIQIEKDTAVFRTPVLEGAGSGIPGLWGLKSQQRVRAMIDTGGGAVIVPGPGGFQMQLSPGSQVIRCEPAMSGHMMIPISDFKRVQEPAQKPKEPRWILYGSKGGVENDNDS